MRFLALTVVVLGLAGCSGNRQVAAGPDYPWDADWPLWGDYGYADTNYYDNDYRDSNYSAARSYVGAQIVQNGGFGGGGRFGGGGGRR